MAEPDPLETEHLGLKRWEGRRRWEEEKNKKIKRKQTNNMKDCKSRKKRGKAGNNWMKKRGK